MQFERVSEFAKLPMRGSEGAVGYDVHSTKDVTIPKGKIALVPTGLKIASLPLGCYLRIAPRSGLAVKKGIHVLAGVVDPDYRGEIQVVLQNHGGEEVHLALGSRVAQFILEMAFTPEVGWAQSSGTSRGEGGFGSTGI